jgi:hypothetical protein
MAFLLLRLAAFDAGCDLPPEWDPNSGDFEKTITPEIGGRALDDLFRILIGAV